jgi:hypothetical protein
MVAQAAHRERVLMGPRGEIVTIDVERRMTADEVALLKEVVRWRRNHGIELVRDWSRYRFPDGRSFAWLPVSSHATCMKIGVTADVRRHPFVWYRVPSIGQAVDLLAMFGYLPVRFSSAYRAGWEAAMVWEKCEADDPVFRRMFHDPENISFPAREPAW